MITRKEPVLCLSCNAPVKGRSDKKFCNDYCRNDYNNNLKSGTVNLLRNINNALSRNRRILQSFIPEGGETGTTSKEKLSEKGFLFKYITHTYTNRKGNVYFFCYDTGYLPLEGDRYLIVKRNN